MMETLCEFINQLSDPAKLSSESGYYFTAVMSVQLYLKTFDNHQHDLPPEKQRRKIVQSFIVDE
jgi:hypothetical protein